MNSHTYLDNSSKQAVAVDAVSDSVLLCLRTGLCEYVETINLHTRLACKPGAWIDTSISMRNFITFPFFVAHDWLTCLAVRTMANPALHVLPKVPALRLQQRSRKIRGTCKDNSGRAGPIVFDIRHLRVHFHGTSNEPRYLVPCYRPMRTYPYGYVLCCVMS